MEQNHCIFLIFGATGDLAKRKLLPALYFLEQEDQLKPNMDIICIARRKINDTEYRNGATSSIREFSRVKVKDEILNRLLSKIHYYRLDFSSLSDYSELRELIKKISGHSCKNCERIFYLAVPSSLLGTIVNNLRKTGLAERSKSNKSYNRIMFEKPFGYDLKSARELNKSITKVFDEKQIYRIDHYLAKELVQNLLVLRFANSIFEPLWNKKYIDHIQITVAETLGVENRGDYYEKSGAIRDVLQNHMMQLLTLVGMEAPKSMNADDVKDEKVKVLKSTKRLGNIRKTAVIGQYKGYTKEPEVNRNSKTETYAALKLEIDNKILKGVPFYLRTGKKLKDKSTEIAIVYKKAPFKLFSKQSMEANMLIIRVQPYEGITLDFNAKVPGKKVIIDNVTMDFCHECKFGPNSPEAYEKLLYDVMLGDQTLFTRWDEVENAWKITDAVKSAFKNSKTLIYEKGTWGPKEADKLIEKDGRKWIEPKKPAYAEQLEK